METEPKSSVDIPDLSRSRSEGFQSSQPEVDSPRPSMEEAGAAQFGANYASLVRVLVRAAEQAAGGKGRVRHANDLPFEEQRMQTLIDLHGYGFAAGQASKKVAEGLALPPEQCKAEILGAINYLAGIIVHMNRNEDAGQGASDDAVDAYAPGPKGYAFGIRPDGWPFTASPGKGG